MERFIDKELCAKCKGACCKECGCGYLPTDFEKMKYSYLTKQINKGNISITGQPIDCGRFWTYLLYLRARNVGGEIVEFVPNGNPCVFLGENGCTIEDYDKRPSFGLMLRPTQIGGPCDNSQTEQYSILWVKYNDLLTRLIRSYTKKELEEALDIQMSARELEVIEKLNNGQPLSKMDNVMHEYANIMMKPYMPMEKCKSLILGGK